MIPVDDITRQSGEMLEPVAVDLSTLDEESEVQFGYADAVLDDAAARLKPSDDMAMAELSLNEAPFPVIFALKQRWESGGWIVGVFRIAEDAVRVVLARPREQGVSRKAVTEALAAREVVEKSPDCLFRGQTVLATRAPRMSNPLLVRMPTRGRPAQALACLAQYRAMADDPVQIEVVIDEDDETMNRAEVLQVLCDLDCTITVGRHKTKIEAVNAGRVDDFATLLLASDDMWPVVHGYDRRIVQLMAQHWPLHDGALTFNDGYNVEHQRLGEPVLCTLPVIGRHLLEQQGYVYYPGYGSLYADDEYTRVLTAMRRLTFVDELLIEHRHPATGKAHTDALYHHNDSTWGEKDREIYEARALQQFGMWPMMLSVLICTIPEREKQLRRLVDWLRWQMHGMAPRIEICVDGRVGVSVGEKRQALLERARGSFVAFIDDDDWVSHDYLERIERALVVDENVDCLSLVGLMTTNGEKPERFEHSMKYGLWYTDGGVHYRGCNHLNVVKRELALKVGFEAKSVGEDYLFSMKLRALLKTEASTGTAPLYFYWHVPEKSVQRGSK